MSKEKWFGEGAEPFFFIHQPSGSVISYSTGGEGMWVILPAVSLAIVHIAGDNLAVVPDKAAVLGNSIYITVFFAYMICGVIITGISAWIGVQTGQELTVVARKVFGCKGKKILALFIIAICIPASALTGGYFSGWALCYITGIPQWTANFLCVALFTVLAAGWGNEILHVSNYIALLLMPVLCGMFIAIGSPAAIPPFSISMSISNINWPLVLALVGYNAGGMRPALVVEAAAYLTRKKNKAVVLAIVAKLVEGIFTLLIAHMVLTVGSHGPLAIADIAASLFGNEGSTIFNILLLCTFMNTMVPAMNVNARQIGLLTGASYYSSLAVAAGIVYLGSCINPEITLSIISITGVFMSVFILLTACFVHKFTAKQ